MLSEACWNYFICPSAELKKKKREIQDGSSNMFNIWETMFINSDHPASMTRRSPALGRLIAQPTWKVIFQWPDTSEALPWIQAGRREERTFVRKCCRQWLSSKTFSSPSPIPMCVSPCGNINFSSQAKKGNALQHKFSLWIIFQH